MTAPVSYLTASRIIRYGYMDSGIIGKQQDPTSEQMAEGMNRLNDIINLYQTQGLKLWLISDTAVTLTAGKATYNFSPTGDVVMTKPMKVINGYWVDTDGNRTSLNVMSWEEYLRVSNTTNQGAINAYFVNKQATHMDVSFWQIPDSNAALGTAHVLLQQQVTNFVSLTDNMNFPMEWAIALRWALADDLSTGQPQEIVMRCQQRAGTFKVALEDWDVEDGGINFTPDPRFTGFGSSFR